MGLEDVVACNSRGLDSVTQFHVLCYYAAPNQSQGSAVSSVHAFTI